MSNLEKLQNITNGTIEGQDLVQPFRIVPPGENVKPGSFMEDTPSVNKLYLLLLYITSSDDNVEEEHIFKFVRGRQNAYDALKELLETEGNVDCMKSRVLVDSPKIQISHKCSVFTFMRDMKERKLIEDDSRFDIYDYYYEEAEEDGEE